MEAVQINDLIAFAAEGKFGILIATILSIAVSWLNTRGSTLTVNFSPTAQTIFTVILAAVTAGLQSFLSQHDATGAVENIVVAAAIPTAMLGMPSLYEGRSREDRRDADRTSSLG